MYSQFNEVQISPKEGIKANKICLLNDAIESFNGAASSVEKYYRHLQQRVKELDIELKNKNEKLLLNLKEKEEAKNYLNNILESITSGVVVINLKGKITTINGAAQNMLGLASEEFNGKHFDDVFCSNTFRNIKIDFKSLIDISETDGLETVIWRKDKSRIHVKLSVSSVKDPTGSELGIVLDIQDITQMKSLEKQASRTGRLAAMGEMAANIAHEIRNPLGSIELFAGSLRKDLEGFNELEKIAEHISSGVSSINNIISNMLLFVNSHQKPEFQLVDICDILKNSLFFSDYLLNWNNGIKLVTNFYSKPLIINGDSELLKQVSLNLILNAIQAMPNGGRLGISTRKVKGQKKGEYLAQIVFDDNGMGISMDNMSKIFNPFFTTKNRGTGLGLSIVHSIVKIHDGIIEIDNSARGGTVCIVTLPLCENAEKIQKYV